MHIKFPYQDLWWKGLKYVHSLLTSIAPDKAAYGAFTQFRGPKNAIKYTFVRTKTQ